MSTDRRETRDYYNEIDATACAWLSNLMDDGLIPAGHIDNRDIRDVTADDVRGYGRVHLFAGIGIWARALVEARWRGPAWTISCPCPPFSSAGKKKACPDCGGQSPIPCPRRTGVFICCLCEHSWLADERHLWPESWRLIRDARPMDILGEQVASADGRIWLSSVRSSLEILAYDPWAVDTCAAGFGAPHIRQRLYFAGVADAADADGRSGECGAQEGTRPHEFGGGRSASRGAACRVEHADLDGRTSGGVFVRSRQHGEPAAIEPRVGEAGGMANAVDGHVPISWARPQGRDGSPTVDAKDQFTSPTNGLWRDADWLRCRDEAWRPVEPGSFPLADAGTYRHRMAGLSGAGNAVNLAQATAFILAVMARGADHGL